MSDTKKSMESELATPLGSEQAEAAAKLARRRRFIKLGASAVPVTLTLTSRPVLAWHCHSTSAWGSAKLANQVGSAQTRLGNMELSNECWYISDWKSTLVPWAQVGASKMFWTTSKSDSFSRTNLKVSQLFPAGLYGCSTPTTTTVYSLINVSAVGDFRQALCVARLNKLFATGRDNISLCVMSGVNDQILSMAKLGPAYSPPNNGTVKWSTSDIVTYLFENWIAR